MSGSKSEKNVERRTVVEQRVVEYIRRHGPIKQMTTAQRRRLRHRVNYLKGATPPVHVDIWALEAKAMRLNAPPVKQDTDGGVDK